MNAYSWMWNLLLRTFDLLCSYFELWWSKINFESLFLSKLHDQVQSSISRWRLIGLFKLICVHFHLVSFNSWSVFLICWSLLHLGYSYVLQWIWLILKYDECFRLSFRIYVLLVLWPLTRMIFMSILMLICFRL
jgi:hypothetical protein